MPSALDNLALDSLHELAAYGVRSTLQDVPHALSGLALHWHGLDNCTLVAFDCLLRTGTPLQSKNRGIAETISWRFLPSKLSKYILRKADS